MPLHFSEMMVTIRAQDFASRTLRRVGGEFAHMSRQQMIAAKRADLAFRKSQAVTGVNQAQQAMKPLRLIQRRIDLTKRLALEEAAYANAQARLARSTPTDTRLLAPAQKQLMQDNIRGMLAAQKQAGFTRHQIARLDGAINSLGSTWMRARDSSYHFNREMGRAKANLANAYNGLDRATRAQLAFDHAVRQMPMQRLQDIGRVMSGLGRTAQLFGGIATVAFGAAANMAAQFDTSISAAATQARDIGASADQVQDRIDQLTNGFDKNGESIDGVLDLMQRFPHAQEDMAASAYEVFSGMDLENKALVDVAKGMGLLERANQIAVAGNVELEEATSAMITTFNNFGSSTQEQAANLDTMFDIVRFGRMRLSDFNIMMNKIAPAAADAGMKLEDVGGAMAYLTRVMPSQRMVATGISRLIEALRHPDIVKGLKMMGVDAKDATGRMRPLDKILEDIAARFPAMRTGQQSAAEFFRMISAIGAGGGRGQIFTAEGRRALSEMMTHFEDYMEVQGQIERNHGEFGATLEAQMQSLGVQWNIFMNQVKALLLIIGQEAIPVFARLGEHIGRFVAWFKGLDPELRRQIVTWAVYAAIATTIGGVILSIVGVMAALVAALKLAGFSMEKGRLRALGLATALRAIAAFAALQVLIKVTMGGDPTAMDFLQAAMAGGLLGASLGGAPGAVLGAIILPVIVKVMADHEDPTDTVRGQIEEKIEGWSKSSTFHKYGRYVMSNFEGGMKAGANSMSFDEFKDFRKTADMLDARERSMNRPAADTRVKDKQDKVTKSIQNGQKAWDKYIESMKKYRGEVKAHEEEMDRWQDSLVQATAQAKDEVMSNLRSLYDGFLAENERAFGEFMQGPWLTSESFDLAKEWGITAGIDDLIRDLDMQNDQFSKWRTSLDQLMKKGLPTDLIDEFRKMGPEEGQGIVDNLLNAKPGQVNALIAQWKRRSKQIQSATKMDFVDEIARFKKAGLNMGDAIVNGFQSAQVGAWFDNWIKKTFPGVIDGAMKAAMDEFYKANPKPKVPVQPKKPPIPKVPPRTPTSVTTDNSSTATVTVNMGDSGRTAQENAARERHAAFVMANAMRGVNKHGGR